MSCKSRDESNESVISYVWPPFSSIDHSNWQYVIRRSSWSPRSFVHHVSTLVPAPRCWLTPPPRCQLCSVRVLCAPHPWSGLSRHVDRVGAKIRRRRARRQPENIGELAGCAAWPAKNLRAYLWSRVLTFKLNLQLVNLFKNHKKCKPSFVIFLFPGFTTSVIYLFLVCQ